MALHWSVENVADHDNVCFLKAPADDPSRDIKKGDQIWNPVTTSLVWATIAVDLGEITEKNAAEFYARLAFVEKHDGPFLTRGGEPRPITPQDVRAHIGLTANVSNKTRSQWMKRFLRDLDRHMDRYDRELEKAAA